jgi:hypothetical protein
MEPMVFWFEAFKKLELGISVKMKTPKQTPVWTIQAT